MKHVKLGSQGLTVSRLGLGCMGMSQWYGEPDDVESVQTLQRAIDLGVNFFDSAEAYGPFTNETLIGKALKGIREKAVIATKFGFDLQDGKIVGVNSRPEHIVEVVNASLKRLDTDYIDVLYQHRLDPSIPIEEVVGLMGDLVHAGKVRFLGLCEVGVSTIERAHRTHPLSVVQSEYSLWERNIELDVLPVLRRLGIGLVSFCPLGRGFLTGTVERAEHYPPSDFRAQDPRLQGDNYDNNMSITKEIRTLATLQGMSPSQLAISWILAQGDDIVPIPGTKRRKYLEENCTAASVQLSPQTLHALDKITSDLPASGPRYNERMMAFVDR
ncbi:aldo/keto reductase [Pseudomonas savastanoi]|uniref:Aldo/keto reductase n=5 Tax=Pseudomonas savastanoi TaxID=29438 RepID=A0A0P9RN52_PSESG|nr:aldo/keto reductase [Pseudomonas savastanoi]EFW78371.1 aldo/keto reductase [Pseudomonas savastanoi pv. glycinea str. B076]EFW87861.1 aldo/keto reductase [Pseudomonas savastanoi pv. glycinea str. race 4]EGH07364.1 aldo/keto reductase [Pseudomonas savastanoi pv. glycinea str. race 4]KPC24349.1 Aldo/keto reductase [Pseudomonas savastanoi pv. glycinea]KPC37038.1 Aldo/keto reductase [Pseudomonas savastanoi pv. glycinea]